MWVYSETVDRLRMARWTDLRTTLLLFCAVYSVLLDLCEDKAQCQVLAESTTFQQDPCPDTYKYLEVHYKCRPDEFERLTVCEGEQMEISCRKSRRIAIYSAMFGRVPNGSSLCPASRPGYISCQATDTISEVRTACQGRKRCDLQAVEDVFGNPCASGINKYLTVTYTCVPKKLLKQVHRHRGHLGANRKRKKKKKKKEKGEVTKLTIPEQDSDTTSPSGALSETQSTELLETYLHTETVEKASAETGAETQDPVTLRPHQTTSPPSRDPDITSVAARDRESAASYDNGVNPNSPVSDLNKNSSISLFPGTDNLDSGSEEDWYSVNRGKDQLNTDRATNQFDPDRGTSETDSNRGRDGTNRNSELYLSERDRNNVDPHRDRGNLNSHRDKEPIDLKTNQDNSGPGRHWSKDQTNSRNNSASATRGGGNLPSRDSEEDMSAKDADVGGSAVGNVTDVNLTVLCVNQTVGAPTVRTLPSHSETPVGAVKELFSVVQFVQGHQEKAVLYLVLGVCVGLILLLTSVLARVCYRMKRNTHAKLDMMEPTHSRNISHLVNHMNHHSVLETPMLEHSDSIDRIEVVRFEPRGTMRSGYHSTLHSDSGDRSLNNYYG